MDVNRELDFVVTGLPRSGLAWCANYLTHGKVLCMFDLLKHGATEDGPDYLPKWLMELSSHGPGYIGIADHSALLFYHRIHDLYPRAKWILIERPYSQCQSSVKEVLGRNGDLYALAEKINEHRQQMDLVVPFDSLGEAIQDVARLIDPGWHYCGERHRMLNELNVQMNPKIAFEQAKLVPFDNALRRAVEPIKPIPANAEYFALLKELCGDNQLAYDFLDQAVEAALFFDHVSDGDPINPINQDKVMKSLMILWPTNQFVRQFALVLAPVMSMAMEAWRVGRDYDVYVLLPLTVAFCLGGPDRVAQFGERLRAIVVRAKEQDDARDNDQTCGTLTKENVS